MQVNLDHHWVESRLPMLDFASVSHNRLLSGRCQMDLCCRNTSRELLGSWPAISLRETIVARLEMKICTSTALVSISCKPIRAARGRSSMPCPALPRCPQLRAAPREKRSFLWLVVTGSLEQWLFAVCLQWVDARATKQPYTLGHFVIFKAKHLFLKNIVLESAEARSKLLLN